MDNEALREELANYAHEAWSDWMNYLLGMSRKNDDGSVTIPQGFVERWARQIATPYPLLSAKEQQSDLDEADRMLKIMSAYRE